VPTAISRMPAATRTYLALGAVVKLSEFATANADRLEAMDINPLRLIEGEAIVLDATIVLR
jgi:hypothetical protein